MLWLKDNWLLIFIFLTAIIKSNKTKGIKHMKNSVKKIFAILSATSLLFLGACADNPVNTPENTTVEVAVDNFTAEFIFGENGLIEKEKKFYDNKEVTYEYYECYEYNEDNQITKRYATDLEGNILEKHDLFEMVYNENGDIEKITEDEFTYSFVYNDDGSLKGYTKFEDTQAVNTITYEYDENGNKAKESSSNAENETVSDTVYTYNEKGLVVSAVFKSLNDTITNEINYEYNKDGIVTKQTRKNEQETRTTVYEYKNGVLAKETMNVIPSDKSVNTRAREYVTTYEYFENGKVIKFSREKGGELYITDAYSADEVKGNFAELNNYVSL